jgi:DNA-binding transcriptional ArsR family regulator
MVLKDYEKIFKALANKRRLSILVYLSLKNEATVGEIAKKIKLSIKATSKHLILIANTDILEKEQRNLLVFYRISPKLPKNIQTIINLFSNSLE